MAYLELRGWETYGRALWHEGMKKQHLSFIRYSDGRATTVIISIDQKSPEQPAIISAKSTPRYTTNDEPMPVSSAVSSQERREFMALFKALPGTPANVEFQDEM